MGFLTGKTAIITGAGYAVLSDGRCGSIGYGIATAYAKEGANLVITGRNVQKLEKAKEELERLYGIRVLTVAADISAGADNEAIARVSSTRPCASSAASTCLSTTHRHPHRASSLRITRPISSTSPCTPAFTLPFII
jgi:NAD(P)-dependent dehydrogenase (short-subunit alcohol dehydrogenase family)